MAHTCGCISTDLFMPPVRSLTVPFHTTEELELARVEIAMPIVDSLKDRSITLKFIIEHSLAQKLLPTLTTFYPIGL